MDFNMGRSKIDQEGDGAHLKARGPRPVSGARANAVSLDVANVLSR